MRLLAILALLYVPVTSFSQEPVTLKNFEAALEKLRVQAKAAVQRIESQAEVQLKDVAATFEKEAEAIRKDFLARLEEFQVESTKAGDLDSALTARDEKQKLAAMKLALVHQAEQRPEPKKRESKKETPEDNLTGRWLSTNIGVVAKVVSIYPNGTFKGEDNGGRWVFNQQNRTAILFRSNWRGQYTLSVDGDLLTGVNQVGTKIWMIRLKD
jgi:hypothetical protein